MLVNNASTYLKKHHIDDIEDEATITLKINTIREKKVSVKQVGNKSSKASILISRLAEYPVPEI